MAILLPPNVEKEEPPKDKEALPVAQDPDFTPKDRREKKIESTKEEIDSANLVSDYLFKNLKTEGALAAFFRKQEIINITAKWMEEAIEAIILQICTTDRQRVLTKLDSSIKEQLRIQQSLKQVRIIDSKIAEQIKSRVSLDGVTCQAVVTALINIMGNLAPPNLKINVVEENPSEGE